jgi:hypothetical protein
LFFCLAGARVLIVDWRIDYNQRRTHRALGMMTPVAFAANLRQPSRPSPATTSGEGGEQRDPLLTAADVPQLTVSQRRNGRVLLRRSLPPL